MASPKKAQLVSKTLQNRRELKTASRQLAKLNRELAMQMIVLASQTGDVNALVQSAQMLRDSRDRFGPDTTPLENAEIHLILAATLHQIARTKGDSDVLDNAIIEYRHAITLASVTNNEALRARIRKDYNRAQELSRNMKQDISRKGVA